MGAKFSVRLPDFDARFTSVRTTSSARLWWVPASSAVDHDHALVSVIHRSHGTARPRASSISPWGVLSSQVSKSPDHAGGWADFMFPVTALNSRSLTTTSACSSRIIRISVVAFHASPTKS